MTETVSRWEVLASMSEEDRLLALGDEMFYGQFWAEHTGDGWKRLEPEDQLETEVDGTEGLHIRETPGFGPFNHQGVIRDLSNE